MLCVLFTRQPVLIYYGCVELGVGWLAQLNKSQLCAKAMATPIRIATADCYSESNCMETPLAVTTQWRPWSWSCLTFTWIMSPVIFYAILQSNTEDVWPTTYLLHPEYKGVAVTENSTIILLLVNHHSVSEKARRDFLFTSGTSGRLNTGSCIDSQHLYQILPTFNLPELVWKWRLRPFQ